MKPFSQFIDDQKIILEAVNASVILREKAKKNLLLAYATEDDATRENLTEYILSLKDARLTRAHEIMTKPQPGTCLSILIQSLEQLLAPHELASVLGLSGPAALRELKDKEFETTNSYFNPKYLGLTAVLWLLVGGACWLATILVPGVNLVVPALICSAIGAPTLLVSVGMMAWRAARNFIHEHYLDEITPVTPLFPHFKLVNGDTLYFIPPSLDVKPLPEVDVNTDLSASSAPVIFSKPAEKDDIPENPTPPSSSGIGVFSHSAANN